MPKPVPSYCKDFLQNEKALTKFLIPNSQLLIHYFYNVYKLDKTYSGTMSFEEAEKTNLFLPTDSLAERINQGWYLSAMAHGIDPLHPPKMEKRLVGTRKHSK